MPISEYFWIIAILIGCINYFILKIRISKSITDQKENDEANKFVKLVLFYITIPFFLLGIFQLLGGFKDLFFIFSNDFTNIYVALSWFVIIGCWLILLQWVLFKDGAKMLIKYKKIIGSNLPNNEVFIKVFFILIVTVFIISLIFSSKSGLLKY